MKKFNSRILIVDDETSVQKTISLTLCPQRMSTSAIDGAAEALFGDVVKDKPCDQFGFEVNCASSGQEAVRLVETAQIEGKPYTMVFCDMRMPGWDGLKTIEEIRKLDERLEVVFLTAFSDHSFEEITRSVGVNFHYMSKPFSRPHLHQMAVRCVVNWNKARTFETFLSTLSQLRGTSGDTKALLDYVSGQLSELLDSGCIAIAEQTEQALQFRSGIGKLARQTTFDQIHREWPISLPKSTTFQIDGAEVLAIKDHGLVLALTTEEDLTTSQLYLTRVFLEHASIAIENRRLENELLGSQRLAQIGEAMSFISHDLRGPIGLAEKLIERLKENKPMRFTTDEALGICLQSLEQARLLANDILLYSNNSLTVNPVATDLRDFLRLNEQYWLHLAENHNVELVIEDPPAAEIIVDGYRLIRAVTNIIKNAIEACSEVDCGRVCISASINGDQTDFKVCDNAGGVPIEIRESLFQPFASFGKSGGTGIGLAIAKRIVDLHSGSIDLQLTADGTEFKVSVPYKSTEMQSPTLDSADP